MTRATASARGPSGVPALVSVTLAILFVAGTALAIMPTLADSDFAATWRSIAESEQAQNDPDAWATAARAAIAHVFYGLESDEAPGPWIDRAQAAADRALALDPDHVPALLLRAQAMGERAQSAGFPDPLLPGALRSLLEHAYALAPEAADTRVALGLLHLELTRLGVGWIYGGRTDRGHALTREGLEVAPDDRIDLRLMVGRMHLDRSERERGLEVLHDAVRAADSGVTLGAFQREALREVQELLREHEAP